MDKELKKILNKEKKRQNQNIELIASENYTSKAVRDLQGSILKLFRLRLLHRP